VSNKEGPNRTSTSVVQSRLESNTTQFWRKN